MPTYDFKCTECEHIKADVLLKITHKRGERPICCGNAMDYYITSPPLVHWVDPVIEPFRAIATKDRPVITSTKQDREYMARNGLIHSDELGPPPTHEDQAATHEKVLESINAISPDADTSQKMADQGLLDPST